MLQTLSLLIKVFFIKDPCKLCLVRACCLEACDEVNSLKKFIEPYESVKEVKFIYSCVLYCWLSALGTTIYLIIKGIKAIC